MNYQPTDYLNNLNLDFDQEVSPTINDSTNNDLSLFSGVEFFDLDVFSQDAIAPSKQQQQLLQQQKTRYQRPYQQQPQQSEDVASAAQQTAKPESFEDDMTQFLNIPEGTESQQTNSESSVHMAAASPVSSVSSPSVHTDVDKRKRNTAASARFRIKKKLKEQQMEQRTRELQDRIGGLEKKLKTLEMENKCLKNLILQKNENKDFDLLQSIKEKSKLDYKSDFQYTI